jgi:O-antigen/teichoic acid export membrane protein
LLSWGLYFVAPSILVPILGRKFSGTDSVIMMMSTLGCMWASEIGMGRVMFAADLQIARAVGISLGAASALVLNLLLVPIFAVNGAILAALASYVLINSVYFIALLGRMPRGDLSCAVLIPFFALAAGAAVVWLCAAHGTAFWTQGLASASAFVVISGGGFWVARGRRLVAARVQPNSTTTLP